MDSLAEVQTGDEVFLCHWGECGMDSVVVWRRVTVTRAAKETLYMDKRRFRRADGGARDETDYRWLRPINAATLAAEKESDARRHKERVRWEMLNLMESVERHCISVAAMEQIIAIIKQNTQEGA